MQIRDSSSGYGIVTRWLHWTMAVAILGVAALGLWMVSLDYYSPYYNSAPNAHRSVGIILTVLLVVRFVWVLSNTKPTAPAMSGAERVIARLVHWSFYLLLLIIGISGYLISTGEGQPVSVFGWVSIPAVYNQQGIGDRAGLVHELAAYAVIALAGLHSVAALKHHYIDRSRVLIRMWRGTDRRSPKPPEA